MADLSGSLVAIVTPFRDGAVDLDAFARLVDWHIEEGTAGIVVAGTTGEAATLHFEEREALVQCAVRVANGRVPVVYGSGTNATWLTIQLTRSALEWGVDAFLVVTPYYNKPTQRGMEKHFTEVARAAAGTPVILYDVPGRTGVTLAEETIERLAEIPGIVALKDATHDVDRAERLARNTSLTLLSGDDALTLPLMKRGARGVISVAANVVPARMAQLCADQDEATHAQLAPLFKACFVESNPIPVKFLLARMGRIQNELRLPLTPLAGNLEETVLGAMP